MVRNYKRKSDSNRVNYSQEDMVRALLDLENGETIRTVSAHFKIPVATLHRRWRGTVKNPGQMGHPTALLLDEERAIASNIAALSDYGLAFDLDDLRRFVQHYLNKKCRYVSCFKENLPGVDWGYGFLKRHKDIISNRHCQNISRKRAAVSDKIVEEYFQRLQVTLDGVPPQCIVNYDETNLTDDPKTKLMLFRKGARHAERIINTTKTSTSIMFAVTASGRCLPPYVVYKGQRLQEAWITGGPLHVKYNVSKSGWFDEDLFIDWLKTTYIPYIKTLPEDEPKVLIGDNLSSHISFEVIDLCVQNNVRLTFLPPNSTHLLQPLDVGCFAPLKKVWRKILTDWKMGDGKHYNSMPKWCFPRLLLGLLTEMEDKWPQLCASSFKTCGIYPYHPDSVLWKMRPEERQPANVSEELLSYLKEIRETSVTHNKTPRRKKINVQPGASVTLADISHLSSGSPSTSGAQGAGTGLRKVRKGRKVRRIQNEDTDEDENNEDQDVSELEVMDQDVIEIEGAQGAGTGLRKVRKGRKVRRIQNEDTDEDESNEDQDVSELEVMDQDVIETEKERLSEVENINTGNYCLVRFALKKSVVYYVGKIKGKGDVDGEWEIDYYRKCDNDSDGDYGYVLPQSPDEGLVSCDDIVCVLKLKTTYKNKIIFGKHQFPCTPMLR